MLDKLLAVVALIVVLLPFKVEEVVAGAASSTDADLVVASLSLMKVAVFAFALGVGLMMFMPYNKFWQHLALVIGSGAFVAGVICWVLAKGDKSQSAQTSYFVPLGVGAAFILLYVFRTFRQRMRMRCNNPVVMTEEPLDEDIDDYIGRYYDVE